MTRIVDIKQAVEQLSPEELATFRAWFEELQADLWDQQIERDVTTGRLDRLAEEARADYKAGLGIEIEQSLSATFEKYKASRR